MKMNPHVLMQLLNMNGSDSMDHNPLGTLDSNDAGSYGAQKRRTEALPPTKEQLVQFKKRKKRASNKSRYQSEGVTMEGRLKRREKMVERRAKLEQRDWIPNIKADKKSPKRSQGRKKSKEEKVIAKVISEVPKKAK